MEVTSSVALYLGRHWPILGRPILKQCMYATGSYGPALQRIEQSHYQTAFIVQIYFFVSSLFGN